MRWPNWTSTSPLGSRLACTVTVSSCRTPRTAHKVTVNASAAFCTKTRPSPVEGSRSAKKGATRGGPVITRETLRSVLGAIFLLERDVAVRVDERARLRPGHTRERERQRERRAVVVFERGCATRCPDRNAAADVAHVIARAVPREPQPDARSDRTDSAGSAGLRRPGHRHIAHVLGGRTRGRRKKRVSPMRPRAPRGCRTHGRVDLRRGPGPRRFGLRRRSRSRGGLPFVERPLDVGGQTWISGRGIGVRQRRGRIIACAAAGRNGSNDWGACTARAAGGEAHSCPL